MTDTEWINILPPGRCGLICRDAAGDLFACGLSLTHGGRHSLIPSPCFCGQPNDRERVHRAHACEPWVTRG